MRKSFLVFVFFILSSIVSMAQTDVIYTTNDDGLVIFGCKINEVKYGNMVNYTKDNVTTMVKAYMIVKDGQKIELQETHNNVAITLPENNVNKDVQTTKTPIVNNDRDYSYYQKTYKRAIRRRNIGMLLTIAGMGLAIGSFTAASGIYASNEDIKTFRVMFFVGDIISTAGLIVWISGGVKAHNNRTAMEKIKLSKVSIAPTQNGIGLVFAFK